MQIFAIVVSLAVTAVAVVMTTRAVQQIVRTVRIGQPASRTDNPAGRVVTLIKESLLHTRMLQWTWIGVMHWFVYAAFIVLSAAVATGFVQLFAPHFQLPIIGHWFVYEWVSEGLGLLGTVIGMVKVFAAITTHGVGNPGVLAGGISEALITTAAGLTVAIPSLIGYRYLRGRVDALVVRMEKEAMKFLEALLQHQRTEVIENESPKQLKRRA